MAADETCSPQLKYDSAIKKFERNAGKMDAFISAHGSSLAMVEDQDRRVDGQYDDMAKDLAGWRRYAPKEVQRIVDHMFRDLLYENRDNPQEALKIEKRRDYLSKKMAGMASDQYRRSIEPLLRRMGSNMKRARGSLKEYTEMQGKMAIVNPVRFRMVRIMVKAGRPLDIKYLAERLQVSYTSIGRHIRKLEKAGIIEVQGEGIRRTLRLKDDERTRQMLNDLWERMKKGLSWLGDEPRPRERS